MSEWLVMYGPLALAMLGTGLVSGLSAGLLGVGGGIVIVPVLEWALQFTGVPPDWRMNVAVATSLATIIPTSISSTRAHHARGAVDWPLARAWALPIAAGSAIGSVLAARAHSAALAALFGVVALIVAMKMLLPLDHVRFAERVPRGFVGSALATLIGGVSAAMGIGGGTLAVPTMTLTGEAIHRAVGTAAWFGLLIAVPGTLAYLFAQPGIELPWATLGLVSLVGVALIAPGAWLTAPLGARWAHSLSKRALSIAFGAFLCLVAARMLYRAFVAPSGAA
jgi:uncharacterized membrane protein YfcA